MAKVLGKLNLARRDRARGGRGVPPASRLPQPTSGRLPRKSRRESMHFGNFDAQAMDFFEEAEEPLEYEEEQRPEAEVCRALATAPALAAEAARTTHPASRAHAREKRRRPGACAGSRLRHCAAPCACVRVPARACACVCVREHACHARVRSRAPGRAACAHTPRGRARTTRKRFRRRAQRVSVVQRAPALSLTASRLRAAEGALGPRAQMAKSAATRSAQQREEIIKRELQVRQMWKSVMGTAAGLSAEIAKMHATQEALRRLE
eukprot:4007199-Prymnesium_polylepis.1